MAARSEQSGTPSEQPQAQTASDSHDVLRVRDIQSRPESRSFDLPVFAQEIVRSLLAFTFVIILVLTIVFAFQNVDGPNWANTKELLQLLLPAETALLGSAVGFYFGSRR
jgi:hypothetical protein